ncbi:hypothetical protein FR224_16835 [Salmonella enterica subsp. diarizonae]|uniref:Uncharacterized protein n=1 Tax=Salmonella muenchen TaxID=596 RepID=A0A5W3IQ61_SALMU|nr:hypothetical protein [Salmonella enterica subsp. enterica serovar Muenchen]ECJ2403641.1 hypothetical protein [Salmonella enterica subsp. diarizonae]ECK8188132.1 hypothetical protein [Salmonella enterica subsp. diarizonae]ECN1303293.1 hypothetical protein [Salmonella enterica subsp. enterica serovar Muenchen]EDU5553244.1 hypothetical protein [Salmonella enterica subsp. diarizonae]
MQNILNKLRSKWMRLYVSVVVCLVASLVLYVGLLPKMISSNSTTLVLLGVLLALIYPAFVVLYFQNKTRNLNNEKKVD